MNHFVVEHTTLSNLLVTRHCAHPCLAWRGATAVQKVVLRRVDKVVVALAHINDRRTKAVLRQVDKVVVALALINGRLLGRRESSAFAAAASRTWT